MTLDQIKTNKLQNQELKNKLADNPYLKEKPKFSFFGWLFGKKPNLVEAQIISNDQQIKALRKIHNEVFDDYCEYIEEEKNCKFQTVSMASSLTCWPKFSQSIVFTESL